MAVGSDVANYNIQKGSLHTGGAASLIIAENSADKYTVKLNYEIYKKILVPIPNNQLRGESFVELPPEFRDERGYMELETKGSIELKTLTLKFIRRIKWPGHSDAYQILVIPKNGKSQIEAIYHPLIPIAGWAKIIVTLINKAPVLNGYQLIIDINGPRIDVSSRTENIQI
jgi:hypothetical protein